MGQPFLTSCSCPLGYTPNVSTALAITAGYAFVPLEAKTLPDLQEELLAFGQSRGMEGHTLIAPEGVNGTVAGSMSAINEWKEFLQAKFGPIDFKDSVADRSVFKRWTVRIKPEIVGIKDTGLVPVGSRNHLSPAEWQRVLDEGEAVLVDARNDYEHKIGRFKGSLPAETNAFHDFPAYAASCGIPKDKKVLMYCTGGIRCEKALMEMQRQGYTDVWQLEGGILAYLEQFPHRNFEGECFVFDKRVAVGQELEPSKHYGLCPHCGYAGDVWIDCACGTKKRICDDCHKNEAKRFCSKRCAKS